MAANALLGLGHQHGDSTPPLDLNTNLTLLDLISPLLIPLGDLLILIDSLHLQLAPLGLDVFFQVEGGLGVEILLNIILLFLASLVHHSRQLALRVNIQGLELSALIHCDGAGS